MNNLIEKEIIKNAQVFLNSNSEFRKNAFAFFEGQGLPAKITKHISPRFMQESANLRKPLRDQVIDSQAVIYFTDGIFDPKNSTLPAGITIENASTDSLTNTFIDSFDALNAVASISPQHIYVAKNVVVSTAVTICHTITEMGVNKIVSPRIQFTAEENSEVSVLEFFTSEQNELFQYTTNSFTQFNLAKNSKVEHVKLNQEAKNSLHLGWTVANLDKDARFNSSMIDLGQQAATNNLQINLNNAGAETTANSVFTLEKNETNTIFTTINHKHSHTHSTQLCKGILKDESFGLFNGNIVIAPDAQEVTSSQLNKNLLLSKKAHIDTRPQLLVSADDVKCSHGATVGQLSDEEAFYLESRGINKTRAKEMLMHGFSHEIIQLIKNNTIRKFCEQRLIQK